MDSKLPLDKRKNKMDVFNNLKSTFDNTDKDYIENLINSILR